MDMFHRSIGRTVRAEPVLPVVDAGALYIRRRPRVRLEPQMSGGGQERGLRSSTLPAPLIVGFGAACSVAAQEMEADRRCVSTAVVLRHSPALERPARSQAACQNLAFPCCCMLHRRPAGLAGPFL
jgi:hypothetical protein